MSRIEDIKARSKLATPGPWKWEANKRGIYGSQFPIIEMDLDYGLSEVEDCEFLAHSRDDIDYLLSQINKLENIAEVSNTLLNALKAAWGHHFEAARADMYELNHLEKLLNQYREENK